MPTTSNFGWTTPADTDLVKDGAAAIRTLGNGVDASFLDLKGGSSGQVLAKNSNTDLDFVWVAQDDSNAIQNAIVDAKGDLISATAADTPARLAVGANGTVLTADSAAATGIKWATPAPAKVLQVVTGSTTTEVTSTSTTYATTGISATITPSSASSTILVMLSTSVGKVNSSSIGFKLYRNGSSIKTLSDGINYTGSNTYLETAYAINYIDSPASTSALTYELFFAQITGSTGTSTVNTHINTAGDSEGRIILMELGA